MRVFLEFMMNFYLWLVEFDDEDDEIDDDREEVEGEDMFLLF